MNNGSTNTSKDVPNAFSIIDFICFTSSVPFASRKLSPVHFKNRSRSSITLPRSIIRIKSFVNWILIPRCTTGIGSLYFWLINWTVPITNCLNRLDTVAFINQFTDKSSPANSLWYGRIIENIGSLSKSCKLMSKHWDAPASILHSFKNVDFPLPPGPSMTIWRLMSSPIKQPKSVISINSHFVALFSDHFWWIASIVLIFLVSSSLRGFTSKL